VGRRTASGQGTAGSYVRTRSLGDERSVEENAREQSWITRGIGVVGLVRRRVGVRGTCCGIMIVVATWPGSCVLGSRATRK